MDIDEYAKGITPESQRVFEQAFNFYCAMGESFDGAMQRAIMDEQEFITLCRLEAAEAKEA